MANFGQQVIIKWGRCVLLEDRYYVLLTCRRVFVSQCAQSPCPEVTSFKLGHAPRVNGNKEAVIQAAAGITFSLVLTESGRGMY